MDAWILKQLRAKVLTDLGQLIPSGYFSNETKANHFNDSFQGAKHLSFEMEWGQLAVKIGKKLYFEPLPDFTAQQISASELLMNLGLLACAETSLCVSEQLASKATLKRIPDGNSGNVANQIKTEQIPIFQQNIIGALEQYLHHLPYNEIIPYISLIPKDRQENIINMVQEKSKIINNINVTGSNVGNIQAGENNEITNHKAQSGILTWVFGIIGAVISGVIIYYLTTGA